MDEPPRRIPDRASRIAGSPSGCGGESGESTRPATLDARELLGPTGRVLIEHEGSRHELRLTRNNKLILTK